MKLRFILPTVIWSGFMLLVFMSPLRAKQTLYFELISTRAISHGFLLLMFSYLVCSAFRKQWKFPKLRTNSEFAAMIASGLWIIVGNGIEAAVNSNGISGMNLIFDVTGLLTGIGAFKLIYGTVQ